VVAPEEQFDAVVVGSGFGGSVMACRLAEAGRRVLVLERGKRYPPGSFARSPLEMRQNFWDPSEGRHGLFQLWDFGGIESLVSAGLGGGSLIYANVLIRKDERWFVGDRPGGGYVDWPVTRADLEPHYDQVESMLAPQQYPLGDQPFAGTLKTRALQEAAGRAGLEWYLPNLAVTFANRGERPVTGEPIVDAAGHTTDNLHGRTRYTCRLCGECDIGCNYGSKNTLDFNYLTEAAKRGAEIRDHSEVRRLAPVPEGGYSVGYVQHAVEAEGRPTDTARLPLTTVSARHLVLAAGTFGSTFLLLKNRRSFPALSARLGHGFSGNGDLLGFVHHAHQSVDGERRTRPLAPSHGTVITSTVRMPDRRDGGEGPGCYIQDGGYPGFVDWLVEEADVPAGLVRGLRFVERRLKAVLTRSPQTDLDSELGNLIGDAARSAGVLPLLAMGRDTPNGTMSLRRGRYLALDWTTEASDEYFRRVTTTMETIARELRAEFQINPLWYLRRKVITVHPLGGCAMGTSAADGVTDSYGRVFGHPGLVIADGSVMPGPVGPNPSLTIAALADRFAGRLIDE
jgi:cholesterol oxidase